MRKLNQRPIHKAVSLILVFTLTFCWSFCYVTRDTKGMAANVIGNYRSQQQALNRKIKQAEANIAAAQKKLEQEKSKQNDLSGKIQTLETQMDLYCTKINDVSDAIDLKQMEIGQKNKEIEKNENEFAERVHKLYIINNSSTELETLLEAKSFSDFFNRAKILQCISQSDQQLIHTLSEQKKEMSSLEQDLESKKANLVSTKNSMDSQQQQLNTLYKQSKTTAVKLAHDKAASEAATDTYQKQDEELERKIEAFIAEQARKAAEERARKAAAAKNGSSGSSNDADNTDYNVSASGLMWPLPGYSRISSPYGYRFYNGQTTLHRGIDIPAPCGTSIHAAAAGTVILAEKNSPYYGWHILIDHGSGITTHYEHCSGFYVNVGDVVKQGQVIAAVGSTGDSTGNHLHFEVRINGVPTNPLNYVSP